MKKLHILTIFLVFSIIITSGCGIDSTKIMEENSKTLSYEYDVERDLVLVDGNNIIVQGSGKVDKENNKLSTEGTMRSKGYERSYKTILQSQEIYYSIDNVWAKKKADDSTWFRYDPIAKVLAFSKYSTFGVLNSDDPNMNSIKVITDTTKVKEVIRAEYEEIIGDEEFDVIEYELIVFADKKNSKINKISEKISVKVLENDFSVNSQYTVQEGIAFVDFPEQANKAVDITNSDLRDMEKSEIISILINTDYETQTEVSKEIMEMNINLISGEKSASIGAIEDTVTKQDNINKKQEKTGLTITEMEGEKQETEVEKYLIGDESYNKVLGEWVKEKISYNYWDQDFMKKEMRKLLEGSKISVISEAYAKANFYYTIDLEVSPRGFREMFIDNNPLLQNVQVTDFDKMIKSASMKLYVNKFTQMVDQMNMEVVLSSEGYSKFPEGNSFEMSIKLDWELISVNEPVTIVLPDEAKNAKTAKELIDNQMKSQQEASAKEKAVSFRETEWKTYRDAEEGIIIDYPSHWEKTFEVGGSIIGFMSPLESQSDDLQDFVWVVHEHLSSPYTLEEFARSFVRNIEKKYSVNVRMDTDSMGNKKAKRVSYTVSGKAGDMYIVHVLTKKGTNDVYYVSLISENQKSRVYKQYFDQMVSSFSFK